MSRPAFIIFPLKSLFLWNWAHMHPNKMTWISPKHFLRPQPIKWCQCHLLNLISSHLGLCHISRSCIFHLDYSTSPCTSLLASALPSATPVHPLLCWSFCKSKNQVWSFAFLLINNCSDSSLLLRSRSSRSTCKDLPFFPIPSLNTYVWNAYVSGPVLIAFIYISYIYIYILIYAYTFIHICM